jgi:hypothetical protein
MNVQIDPPPHHFALLALAAVTTLAGASAPAQWDVCPSSNEYPAVSQIK